MESIEEWLLIISYFEMAFIFIVLILIFASANICLRIHLFHPNLVGLAIIMCYQSIISMFLRAIIIVRGFSDPGFCYNETKIWESSYRFVDFACYSVRISLFICLGNVSFERFFACIRISTYEKIRNLKIIFGTQIYSLALGFGITYLIFYKKINMVFLVALAEGANLNGVCFFVFVHWWNKKRYRRAVWDSSYSLSMRFQLNENIKTSLCLKRIILFITICNLFSFLTYAGSYYTNNLITHQISKVCFNYALLIYSIGLIVITIYTIPAYKYKAISIFKKYLKFFQHNQILPHKNGESKRPDLSHLRNLDGRKIVFEVTKEGELYFSQLKDSWN